MFNKKTQPDQSNNNQVIENFRYGRRGRRGDTGLSNVLASSESAVLFPRDTLEKIQSLILFLILVIMLVPIFMVPDLDDLWLWYLIPSDGQRWERIKNSPFWEYLRNSWFILLLLYLTTDVSNLFLSGIPTSRRITVACSTAVAFFVMTVSIKRENTAFSYTSTKLVLISLFILSVVMRFKKERNIERFVCNGNHDEELEGV